MQFSRRLPLKFFLAAIIWIQWHSPSLTLASTNETFNEECHEIRGLIVITQFPDISHLTKKHFVKNRFFKQLNRYVQQVSYGKHCIGGEISERKYMLPNPVSHYKISDRNLKADPRRVIDLIADTITLAKNDYTISQYDFIAIFLEATASEYGMIGLCGYPSHKGVDDRYNKTVERRTNNLIRYGSGVAVFSFRAPLGTVFHDIAHILAGRDENGERALPHLYDNTLQALPGPMLEVFRKSQVNAGYWDPLSCHYVKRGQPPPGPLSWTKLKLGWLPLEKLKVVQPGETARILLGPLEVADSGTLAIKIPISRDTYYLIENRQPIGVDQFLPGHGVLIMFADDRIHRAIDGKAPAKLINANPDIPDLNGAAFDIGGNEIYVDQKNKFQIKLMRKIGMSYEIEIKPIP
jgi:hypothetical protein